MGDTILLNGFSNDDLTSLAQEWSVVNSSGSGTNLISMPSTSGPRGGACVKFGGTANYIQNSFYAASTEVTLGFRMYLEATASATSAAFLSIIGNNGRNVLSAYLMTGNVLRIDTDTSMTWYGRTPLLAANWWYVEIPFKLADSGGSVGAYLNGSASPDVAVETGDTKNTSTSCTQVKFGGMGTSDIWRLADVYAINTIAGKWGSTRVGSYLPSGAGTRNTLTSNLTGTAASTNYQAVDDAAVDGDTSYVSGTSGADTYAMPALGFTASSIKSVVVKPTAKALDASGRTIVATMDRSGSSPDHATTKSPGLSYIRHPFVYDTDPVATGAWSQANYEATHIGQKVA